MHALAVAHPAPQEGGGLGDKQRTAQQAEHGRTCGAGATVVACELGPVITSARGSQGRGTCQLQWLACTAAGPFLNKKKHGGEQKKLGPRLWPTSPASRRCAGAALRRGQWAQSQAAAGLRAGRRPQACECSANPPHTRFTARGHPMVGVWRVYTLCATEHSRVGWAGLARALPQSGSPANQTLRR